MCRFSILVPAYKAAYLDQCLASIVTQDCGDWQLVVVDDASPDDLHAIAAPYLDDPRVTYRRLETGHGAANVVDNWNECLGHATGEFVICMGDDDLLLPGCLTRYNDLIAAHPGLDAYHTRIVVIDSDGRQVEDGGERPEVEDASAVLWHKWQGRRQAIGDWLLRTATLRRNGGYAAFPYGWGSDDVTAAWTATATGVANCNTAGYAYRRHGAAITGSHSPAITLGKLEAWRQIDGWVRHWLPTLPATARYRDRLAAERRAYIAGRCRGDLYHGLTRSPATLWHYLRHVTNVPAPIILALYGKRLLSPTKN